MPSIAEFPAKGKVLATSESDKGRVIVFQPQGTNYELHLISDEPFAGELNKPLELTVRVQARKVYTVPSGGNFIAPIFGPPRIIQGRVRYADDRMLVVHAGTPVIVELPAADSAIDLDEGVIQVGRMVNVTALPGAKCEIRSSNDETV
jgi:hypothetical protein